jgi:TRAP transporter TAXI family solute receptor
LPLSIDDAVAAIEQDRIDAFFWSGGLPTSGITALGRRLPIRLIDLADVADRILDEFGSTYRLGRIPAGVYAATTVAVSTLAVPNYLVTSAGTPDHLVRQVVALLFAGAPAFSRRLPPAARLNRGTAIFTAPIPLHPGAMRYYQSTTG